MLRALFIKIQKDVEKKTVFDNFISLSILQGANYIFPLITFPYLVRVLGAEKWGLLAFASATVNYFQIIIDYGFNLSATKEISIHRNNKEILQEIFNTVMVIKIGLAIISFFLLNTLVLNVEKFKQDLILYYLTFGTVLAQIIFPVWFFQGMEQMKYITFLNIVARGLSTIAIFIFIRHKSDYIFVPIINFCALLLISIISLFIVSKIFGIRIKKIRLENIKYQLKEGWYIFTSMVAINLYTTSTPFILGLLTNNTMVGYYSAADKIIQAVKGIIGAFSQSLYPYIVNKVHSIKEKSLGIIRTITKFVALSTGILSCCIFLLSIPIVNLILGKEYSNSIVVLKILSIHPFLIGLSNIFGVQTMLSFNRKKPFQNIVLSAGILNILIALILVPLYKYIGSAISVTITEMFVTLSTLIYLQKTGIRIIGSKSV